MKKVIITGGTKGIGRVIVEKLAQENCDLAICARNEKDLIALKADLNQRYPRIEVLVKSTDVSQKLDIIDFATFVKSHWARLDILVNNAGVFMPGQILDEEEGVLEQQLATNVNSAYHLTRAVIDLMLPYESGHIFNMCSIASIAPYSYGSSYTISKYALLGFSKALREELKTKGISVTTLLPGQTWSNAWKGSDVPKERLIHPEAVAELIWQAYKLSPAAVIEEILVRPQLGDL